MGSAMGGLSSFVCFAFDFLFALLRSGEPVYFLSLPSFRGSASESNLEVVSTTLGPTEVPPIMLDTQHNFFWFHHSVFDHI